MLKFIGFMIALFLISCSANEPEDGLPDVSREDIEGCYQHLSDTSECAMWCFDTNYNRYVHLRNDRRIYEQIQKYEIGRAGKISAIGSFKDSRYAHLDNPSSEVLFAYLKADTLFSRFEGVTSDFAKFKKVEKANICGEPFGLVEKPSDWYLN